MSGFRFDTVMFPISFVDYYAMGFGEPVLDLAHQQGAAVLAIKALSMGAWSRGAERARQWWYRTTETQEEVSLAMRFVLSRNGVVAGVPPSFLDLLDKAIDAAYSYQPITAAETRKVQQMAATCNPLFRQEEQRVARGRRLDRPVYPDSPHECCPCANA
jgi:predicted aldo/keto reductase-like oxidoreductase